MYVIRFTGYDVPVCVIPCVPIDRVCVSSLYVHVCVDPLVIHRVGPLVLLKRNKQYTNDVLCVISVKVVSE